jgi:hypothetical protein
MSEDIAASATATLLRSKVSQAGALLKFCLTNDEQGISFHFNDAEAVVTELRTRLPNILSPFRESVADEKVRLDPRRAKLAIDRLSVAAWAIEHILCRHSGLRDGTILNELRRYFTPIFAGDSAEREPPLIRIEASVSDSLAWLLPFEFLPIVPIPNEPTNQPGRALDCYLGFRAEIVRCQRSGPRVLPRNADGRFPIRLFPFRGQPALKGVQEQIEYFQKQSNLGTVGIGLDWPRAKEKRQPFDSLAAELLEGNSALHFCCHYDASGTFHMPEPRLRVGTSAVYMFELRSAIEQCAQKMQARTDAPDRPFVFLNACQTAGTPSGETLFRILVDYGYRDIVGSETLAPDRVAAAFAMRLYDALLRGTRFGKAVLQARQSLRELENPGGLIYTYYGNPSLQLEPPPARTRSDGAARTGGILKTALEWFYGRFGG